MLCEIVIRTHEFTRHGARSTYSLNRRSPDGCVDRRTRLSAEITQIPGLDHGFHDRLVAGAQLVFCFLFVEDEGCKRGEEADEKGDQLGEAQVAGARGHSLMTRAQSLIQLTPGKTTRGQERAQGQVEPSET